MRVKQSTSLRVDEALYQRLANLAQDRGTSITRQLEMAIKAHLETTVVEDHLPVIKPVLERVINENLEATVTSKIEELKHRLAGLLAKNAMDTALLYLVQTHRWSAEDLQAWRKRAADHVRGRLVELQADTMASEEAAVLRRQVAELKAKLTRQEEGTAAAVAARNRDLAALKDQLAALRAAVQWWRGLAQWIGREWDSQGQGLLSRRKPFQTVVAEYEREKPRPGEA